MKPTTKETIKQQDPPRQAEEPLQGLRHREAPHRAAVALSTKAALTNAPLLDATRGRVSLLLMTCSEIR